MKYKITIFHTLMLLMTLSLSVISEENNILFLSGSHGNATKVSLLKKSVYSLSIDHKSVRDISNLNDAELLFDRYSLVVFSGVSKRDSIASFDQYAELLKSSKARFLTMNWQEAVHLRKGVSPKQAKRVLEYYSNGGAINMTRLGEYFLNGILLGNDKKIAPPIIYPNVGIYHPSYDRKVFSELETYLSWVSETKSKTPDKMSKLVIGVLFQRASIESDSTALIDELITRIESKGAIAVPFFFELSPTSSDYTYLLRRETKGDDSSEGKTFVDVIVNLRSIHWASERKKEFEKLGVPVLQGLVSFDGDQNDWEESSQGITPNMTPFQLVLPESAGVIDPVVIAATNQRTHQIEIIDYQLQHLVDKAFKIARLGATENKDKKITVMVWGDKDIGAAFLNIPESLRSISHRLSSADYNVESVESDFFNERIDRILNPFYRNYELDALLEDDLAELMPVSEYLSWFNTLPEKVRQPINDYWGEAKDNFMAVKREGEAHFVLPRIRNGNMLVMRQPPRADNADEDKRIYHKGTIPMNHYYLAAYYYAREYWGSDAIVHLGTHGSHEYLPGKERGLSVYDQGNLATWDTPIVYPFIVDDVGEAMQTKRRGSATVIAHMTPPFAAAGLHGEMADMHELIHQYKSLDQGGVKEKTAAQIADNCFVSHICKDIAWSVEEIAANFSDFLDVLHSYMEDLATENQPLGLHTFGELPEERLITSTLIQMLGSGFTSRAAKFESSQQYTDVDEVHSESNSDDETTSQHFENPEGGLQLESLAGFTTVRDYIIDPEIGGAKDNDLDSELQADIDRGKKLYKNFLAIKEQDHLLDFLSGRYIPVKTGGDPIRDPDSLPTGYNLYGFDPSRVPTKAAYEQGKELTEALINDYYQKHGRYPDKLAFSLWSMETMRHYGVLESQALYAMGVKPVWSKDGRVIDSEIIAASELKRPRVDVVLSATGLYRDAFPNVMQWLAKAIRQVVELKEENNSLWDNAIKVEKELLAAGVEPEEAQYLSTVRIFSNASGNYGSGLGDSAIASDTWEADSKLADLYLSRMGYFYGEDNSRWGQSASKEINLYAKQLSGTDMALFSRSSNVFGMLSSDDPFQYFGGLALAVRNIDGKSPEMYISNLRDAKNPKSERAATFLAKELRTRSLHPRWISEMQKEGYSGAVTMAGNVSNFFGWQVMDPNLVRDDQWQEFFEVYVEDKLNLGLNEWFEKVDPKAQATIVERMLEATRKGYWEASDATLKTLIERYQELVNTYDLVVENDKLRKFVEQESVGFGLNLSLPAPEAAAFDNSAAQQVEGQKLEKVEQTPTDSAKDWMVFTVLMGSLLIVILGVWKQTNWAGL